jgi:hypothetical protein
MNITQILLGLILILGGIATLVVWPYIKAHVSSEQLSMLVGIAQTVVYAAEKIFGAKMGKDKLAYALELAKKLLAKKGLTFDEDVIRAAIEAQVEQLTIQTATTEGEAK